MIASRNLAIATLAIISPLWLEWLMKVSTGAALLLPILGVLLAALQILKLFRDWKTRL